MLLGRWLRIVEHVLRLIEIGNSEWQGFATGWRPQCGNDLASESTHSQNVKWEIEGWGWWVDFGGWKNGRLKKRSVFARLECGAEEAIRIFLILECFGWINSFFLFFVHLSPHLLHCIFSYYVHRFSWVFVLLNSGSQRFCNYSTWRRYGFVEFKNEDDADYAIKIMNMIRLGQNGSGLIGTTITANKSGTSGSPLFALHSFLFTYLSSVYGLGSVDEQTSPGTEAVTENLMDAVDISSYFAACPCRLFGKPIRCNKSSQDKKTNEVRICRPPHKTSQSWEGPYWKLKKSREELDIWKET